MPSFEGEPPIGAEIPARAPKSSLESCMTEISGNRVSYSQNQDSLELELNRFLAERCANEKCNPFTWWKNSSSFPNLEMLFKKFFSAPSSSVYSERLFSEYGNIYEETGRRLLQKNSEKLLFLHRNLKKCM